MVMNADRPMLATPLWRAGAAIFLAELAEVAGR
jgi:hypothetical protein